MELFDIKIIFINFDYYYYVKSSERTLIENKLLKEEDKEKFRIKIIISHRPFRCISSINKEVCQNRNKHSYLDEFEKKLSKLEYNL